MKLLDLPPIENDEFGGFKIFKDSSDSDSYSDSSSSSSSEWDS